MSVPLRSKQGCWTCRLRKKKCDETRPLCSTCESLSITCYGYGPKPECIDNSEKEREILNRFKSIIKQTSRRKPTSQNSKLRNTTANIAPKPPNVNVPSFSTDESTPSMPKPGAWNGVALIHPDESKLLMHFLDIVFPLQYPIYEPEFFKGGRGWMLALVLGLKPLYHAALAISAYHRRTSMQGSTSEGSSSTTLVEQENHLKIAVNVVNQFALSSCPSVAPGRLGIMGCIVELFFYELFSNNPAAWQAHLRTLVIMYQRCSQMSLDYLSLSEKSIIILSENLPIQDDEDVVVSEVANFRCLGITAVWLDIIYSTTAGKSPELLSHHRKFLAPTSQTSLEYLMGCKNWAMFQIGRISTLYEQKTRTSEQGEFNRVQFEETVMDIEKEIKSVLSQCSLEGFEISDPISSSIPTNTLITRIFTHMASIYLHLVAHGFQNLEALQPTVAEAISMLQTQIAVKFLPGLVCPLYFIGAVVNSEDEQYIRNLLSSPPLQDPSLKHRDRILPTLEEIWRRRRRMSRFTWEDCLALSPDFLLI